MRGRQPALRSSRAQRANGSWQNRVLSHKFAICCGLAVFWVLFFGISTTRRSRQDVAKHDLSLSEANAATAQLATLDLGQQPINLLREAVQKVARQDSRLWRKRGIQDDGSRADDPLAMDVDGLISQLLGVEALVPCSWDAGLEVDLQQLEGRKYLLTANFKDNEELLPHFIVQLWHLLAVLPQKSAFVSIYESSSKDSTGAWLEVLRQLLTAMRVPHRIAAGGNLTRGEEQERIDFLAQVRNAALEPLWLRGSGGGHGTWFGAQPSANEAMWPADRIVFMNDVYFCAKDVIRLLLHDADMACGMDFDRRKLDQIPMEERRLELGKFLHHAVRLPNFVGQLLGLIPPVIRLFESLDTANKLFQKDLPMGFYDLWVGRDANGALFLKDAPYATDPYSLQRLPWGLPFPVKCCWNGLVALNAAPFIRHGLKMRSHRENECAASECTLLCNDFLRLGYQNLVVDPGVRQAYNPRDARDLYQEKWVRGINITQWADVKTAGPIDASLVPFRPFSQCCGLQPGENWIKFETGCGWENFMRPNFTAMPDKPLAPLQSGANATSAQTHVHLRKRRRWLPGKRRLDAVPIDLE